MRKWSALAREWYAIELGQGCLQIQFTDRILARPDGHPAWGSRERLDVGGPEATRCESVIKSVICTYGHGLFRDGTATACPSVTAAEESAGRDLGFGGLAGS